MAAANTPLTLNELAETAKELRDRLAWVRDYL
jgi:hypothetical protein